MPDFAFTVCARAKRRILDDFGSFLLVLGRYCCFQVLLGLDIPIYHSPETSGTPKVDFRPGYVTLRAKFALSVCAHAKRRISDDFCSVLLVLGG